MIDTFLLSLFATRNWTSGWLALRTSVAWLPNMDASMPPIPYIFIISCILLFSSARTAIEATFSSLSFSTLTSSFSLPSSLRKISTRLSVVFWNSSFSSSATSSFKESCTSASILKNWTSWCFCSRYVINAESMLCVRIIASCPWALNMLMYWLCCTSSVT